MLRAKITSKGQLTVPKAVRDGLQLKPGDEVEFDVREDGTARLIPANLRALSLFGVLKSKKRGVTVQAMNEDVAEAVGEHVTGSRRKSRR